MADSLANGDRVEIRGLCSFFVKEYKAHTERNPNLNHQIYHGICMAEQDDIRVFYSSRDIICDDCNGSIERGELIAFTDARETLCLSCADLDHLTFLPAGNAALTRRSKKHSKLSAVVNRWNKARKRNERQGILVEEKASTKAGKECLADKDLRIQRRARYAKRREIQDREYIKTFIDAILELYAGCPSNTAKSIAERA